MINDNKNKLDNALKIKEKNIGYNKLQNIFLKEIKTYNYSKDEAIAEIINDKEKFVNYREYYKVVVDYFDNKISFKEPDYNKIYEMKR